MTHETEERKWRKKGKKSPKSRRETAKIVQAKKDRIFGQVL